MRHFGRVFGVLFIAMGLGACGGGEGGGEAVAEACGQVQAAAAVPVFDGETATSDVVRGWASGLLDAYRPLTEASSGFTTPASRLVEALEPMAKTGDKERVTEELLADMQAVAAEATERCGFQVVDVRGSDYAFDGLPSTVKPGMTSFRLTGAGDEEHEIQLARLRDEFTGGVDELVAMGAEAFSLFDPYIGGGFCAPGECARGEVGYLLVDLKPGRYVAFCLLPVAGKADVLHVSQGMISLVEVSG